MVASEHLVADPLAGVEESLRPPRELSLVEWADEHFYLSAENSAEPGRWRTLHYQRGIMEAISDPAIEWVTLMKSARLGYTKILNATIGYFIDQDPCPIMVVQPSLSDARDYSKEEIAPMLRDVEVLVGRVAESRARSSDSTLLHKTFGNGSLSLVGAESPRGFRRVSRRVVMFDEVDGYSASAGDEGDQIKLGVNRTRSYHNRKILAGSTPGVAGLSRIEPMFHAGDQRRYHVPCPSCGHRAPLEFREDPETRPHFMRWDKDGQGVGIPESAHFICGENGCVIEETEKEAMLEAGEWIAAAEFKGHASFRIWAAYSPLPNTTWADIAAEFLEACVAGADALKTFIMTWLGQTWQEQGEAPDYQRLFERRDTYPIASVPDGVDFLTAGVDVQKDRLVYEVVGWQLGTKRSWSVDAGLLWGDTSDDATWNQLDELLNRTYASEDGKRELPIAKMAVDSGYNTQQVYTWCRRHAMSRVIACKGVASAMTLVNTPSKVDVTERGRKRKRGYKVWPVGVDLAKSELYGWLKLKKPGDGDELPDGWCSFPEYDKEFFRQLTAEHLVPIKKRTGYVVHRWELIPNRENHYLDCRVYARAAAAVAGLDRSRKPKKPKPAAAKKPAKKPEASPRRGAEEKPSWLQGRRGALKPRGWLKPRR